MQIYINFPHNLQIFSDYQACVELWVEHVMGFRRSSDGAETGTRRRRRRRRSASQPGATPGVRHRPSTYHAQPYPRSFRYSIPSQCCLRPDIKRESGPRGFSSCSQREKQQTSIQCCTVCSVGHRQVLYLTARLASGLDQNFACRYPNKQS